MCDSLGERELAIKMYREWTAGTPKSRLERYYWSDGASHGKRFDRFVERHLGVQTARRRGRSNSQLEFSLQLPLIPDRNQRSEALGLLEDSVTDLRSIADDPTVPESAVHLIESLILPKLQELGQLIDSAVASEKERTEALTRASEIVGDVIRGVTVVGKIGRDLGIATYGVMGGLARVEPALKGLDILIGS